MDNKYFGSLDQRELEHLNDKEKIKYLLDRGYLTETYASSGLIESSYSRVMEATISVNPDNVDYRFNSEIAEELYNFLLNHYGHNIGSETALFSIEFDSETFGLSDKKIKKKGLSYFNKFFRAAIGNRTVGAEFNSKREINAEKRFKTLYLSKRDLKYQLQKSSKFLIDYLLGDAEKFDKNLFDSNSLIQTVINFESNLSKLQSLNNRFNFEKENYFTPKSKSEIIYEAYQDNFRSLKQAQFIVSFFTEKSKREKAEINSLYLFMKDKLEPNSLSEKQFKEIVVNYFDKDFNSRLKQVADTNQTHIKRVKKLNSDWEKFMI